MQHKRLIREIENAADDFRSSNSTAAVSFLRRLARLVDSPELAEINSRLLKGVDYHEFLSKALSNESPDWPDDTREATGLGLGLLKEFSEDPNSMISFAGYYYRIPNDYMLTNSFSRQFLGPFVRDYVDFLLEHSEGKETDGNTKHRRVFIVHGHDGESRAEVARFLEKIGLVPIILHEQANRGRTIIEKVEANSDVDFAVVLLTPDDVGCVKGGTPIPRARQNVMLELGYFIGKLGRANVCALKRGEVELPSDFLGVVWETLDGAGAWKRALARELEAADYVIDWTQVGRA